MGNQDSNDKKGIHQAQEQLQRRQKLTVFIAVGVVAVMLGASLASSPLYRAFCRITGFGGTPLRASDLAERGIVNAGDVKGAAAREVVMRFNGNVEPGLPWRFLPTENEMKIAIGTNNMAYFTAENLSDHDVTGVATFNVTPTKAAPYVVKIACFCFDQQTLAAGEKILMPISFYIDPSIRNDPTLDDVTNITLSYSFFQSLEIAPPKYSEKLPS